MEALAQCYQASDTWEKHRQILSIMADEVRFTKLLRYIPCLTNYRFTDAKRHCLTYGRGGPVKSLRASRKDIACSQIKHFIAFITSSHIVQDLPFGERSITLSNKETIKIPNVMIPERVVKQYLADCDRMSFKPLSRSTLLRILAICPASVWKSLQGLDYASSAGSQAFEDLSDVAERLGDAGKGMMGWTKDIQSRLRLGKRYLKRDYKANVLHIHSITLSNTLTVLKAEYTFVEGASLPNKLMHPCERKYPFTREAGFNLSLAEFFCQIKSCPVIFF